MLMPQELLATFDMKSAGLTILEAAAATATLIIAGTFAFSYGKVQEAIFKSAQERVKRHSRLRPATTEDHVEINRRLTRLLEVSRAFRVCIFQFHNGDVFLGGSHAWKLSQTHEALHAGADSVIGDNQNLPMGAMVAIVGPMLTAEPTGPGVSGRAACAAVMKGCRHAIAGRRILRFDTAAMAMSTPKALMTRHGVDHTFTVCLLDPVRGEPFGFIAVQFQGASTAQVADFDKSACAMCEAAETIQYHLTSEFSAASKKPGRFAWLTSKI